MNEALQRLIEAGKMLLKKTEHRYDLIIYDDIYPHPSSGFRMEEFTVMLNHFDKSKILVSGQAYDFLNIPRPKHREHIKTLLEDNSQLAHKIEIFRGINIHAKLFYCVFLNNMYKHLQIIEKKKIPFVFTLYPGGGFNVGIKETDIKLKEIFSSKFFRGVIVTQQKTYNYLVDNGFCIREQIVFVFGVVMPQQSLLSHDLQKKFYATNKNVFDICFCATRYTTKGEDKGYPVFVEFMKMVSKKYNFIRFHVIGGFDATVINVEEIADRIHFYGYQDFTSLKKIFQNIDLIISPNEPGKLQKGAFDGFPLGTVIEAAFNEVVVMLTDFFGENEYFEDGRELIIIKPNVQDILDKFDKFMDDIESFYEIGRRGCRKFRHIYSNNFQMQPRINLLNKVIADTLPA